MLKQVLPEDFVKFGLIPEFIGRVPINVSLNPLDEEALIRILTEPKSALVKQYQRLFELDGVKLSFTEDALVEIARKAITRQTGARGLRSIVESVVLDLMFQIPSDETVEGCLITAEAVRGEAEPVLTYNKTDEKEEVLDPFIEKKDDGEIA